MRTRTLRGVVQSGAGDAAKWPTQQISKITGFDLVEGTLNVRLASGHTIRSDYRLRREDRLDRRCEDIDFELCQLRTPAGNVPVLIARTSSNFHGDAVLEIMADHYLRFTYDLDDGSQVEIEVREDGGGPAATT